MDIVVSSWAELHERLYEGSWNEPLGRFRSDLAFRGEPEAAGELRTSLAQLGGEVAQNEGHLLRNFRKYAGGDAPIDDTLWNWLALAQHHGLPTRLLDWSFSPYTALHFMTAAPQCAGRDGAIWCVDYVKAGRLLPPSLRRALEAEGSNVFTAEMLQQAAPTLADLQRLSRRAFVVFFEPPSMDRRMVNQYALFSLLSQPTAELRPFLERHGGLWRRLIVPARLKWEVRDKLDQAGINERMLFPGLDGLCRWLTRHYLPREAVACPPTAVDRAAAPRRRAGGLPGTGPRR